MRVKEMMRRDIEGLEPGATLDEAARKMARSNNGSLPVMKAGKPVGVITDRDIVVRALAEGLKPAETTVESVMTTEVVHCREDDDVELAAGLMEKSRVRRIFVLNTSDELTGSLALGDVAPRKGAPTGDSLSSLVKEELAAAETYRQALETVRGPGADELRRIENEHEEAALLLSERIKGGRERPPADGGLWGAWGRTIEDSERFFDERAILKILKLGEEQAAAEYARSLEDVAIDAEIRELIRISLLPKTLLHASVISRLINARVGA